MTAFNPRRYPELCTILGEDILGQGQRSLADDAHDRILLKIVRGELVAGAELKSTRLAAELGVSRTPVIQALSRLISDGVVRQSLNQRAVVRPGADSWLLDLHRTRQLLEPEAVREAAARVTPEVLADLSALAAEADPGLADAAEVVGKPAHWSVAARWFDQSLHLVAAEYCGNLSMRAIVRRCWSYKRLSYEAGNDSATHLAEGWRQHVAILKAIEARDGEKAAALMREHLRSAALGTRGGIV